MRHVIISQEDFSGTLKRSRIYPGPDIKMEVLFWLLFSVALIVICSVICIMGQCIKSSQRRNSMGIDKPYRIEEVKLNDQTYYLRRGVQLVTAEEGN